MQRQVSDYARYVEVPFEKRSRHFIVIKAHVGYVVEVQFAKLFEEPCFSNLPGAVEDERLSSGAAFPFYEFLHKESVHSVPFV